MSAFELIEAEKANHSVPMLCSLAESFVATLKTELLYRSSRPTRQVARTAIFEYIEGFYNTRRRHSALGYLSSTDSGSHEG